MTTRAVRRLFWRPRARRARAGEPEAADRDTARLAALAAGLGRLGHDLRGVLAPALLAAERLQAHSDPAVRRSADALVRAVDRATDTLREGLGVLRQDLPKPRREPVPLAAAIAAASGLDAQCTLEIPAEAVVQGDPVYLRQGWETLLAALHAAGARRITLEGRREGGAWSVACLHDAARRDGEPVIAALPAFQLARDLIRACGGDLTEREPAGLVATFTRG